MVSGKLRFHRVTVMQTLLGFSLIILCGQHGHVSQVLCWCCCSGRRWLLPRSILTSWEALRHCRQLHCQHAILTCLFIQHSMTTASLFTWLLQRQTDLIHAISSRWATIDSVAACFVPCLMSFDEPWSEHAKVCNLLLFSLQWNADCNSVPFTPSLTWRAIKPFVSYPCSPLLAIGPTVPK